MADPIRLLMVAPSGGGKTTLLKQLLHTQIRGQYNNIYLICPTLHQKLWESIKIADSKKSDSATNEQFEKFYDEMKIHGENSQTSLLILDDIVGTELLNKKSAFAREITRMRHNKVSVILLAQYYKSIPPVIRNNMSHYVIFYNPIETEEKKYRDEFGRHFMGKYEEAAREKYKYVFVDTTKNELDPERYTDLVNLGY